jgi:transposase-like protein
MQGRQRRSFTDDYKRQAVDLVVSSGCWVAKELGLHDSVLRRWVEQRDTRLEPREATRRPAKVGKESRHIRIFACNSDHAERLAFCAALVPPICEQRR